MRSKALTPFRWDLGLPVAGVAVAMVLALLAVLAENAFRSRHALALEGRYLRLAHRLEAELREVEPGSAGAVLESGLAAEPEFVAALVLTDGAGKVEARAGRDASEGAPAREIDLFVGRRWARPGPGPGIGRGSGYRGMRTLRIVETPQAGRRPLSELLLLPAVAVTGLVVVALAYLGGRLLVRQQETARLEARRRRLEGLGRAGAGLAHQLRTPLATIKGSCQLLMEDALPMASARLAIAVDQSERMERLLGQLLDYARPPDPEIRRVALGPVLEGIDEFEDQVEILSGRELAVETDEDHLRQILDNLVENAIEAGDPESRVEIAARLCGHRVEIEVADRGDGPGDDPEVLFEPYVTRREGGTGLGLPIARALAQASCGELRLEARGGGGTRAILSLPASGETP